MKNTLFFLLIFSLLMSCKSVVYYYERKDFFGILEKDELTYYYSGYMREFDSDHFFNVYEETNGWQMTDLDSLVKVLNAENKEKGHGPFYNFEEKIKVNLIEKGIIYEHSDPKQIDTFKLEIGVYQNNKKLPIPKYYVSPIASFDDAGNLKRFKNNFVVEYVKDSISYFSDQYFEKMHIFYFYPTIYSNTSHEEILDTSTLSTPIVVGISSVNGVPLYTGTSMPYHEGVFDIQSMACYTWIEINGITRKKIKLLLR